jgi:CheY-like chemotaxis protein
MAYNGRLMRIFLVENHPDTLRYLHRHLVRAGHEVETAQTCADALDHLRAKPCDLLLTDIGLPDGDGWALLEQLGEDRPPLAIAMSGNNNPDVHTRSRKAGFQHHLIKPFLPDDLDNVLRRVAEAGRKIDGQSDANRLSAGI